MCASFSSRVNKFKLMGTQHRRNIMFCYDKKEIKEIEEKWDNMGLPDVCFIISKNDKYYVLAYLAADDNYYPFYFKKTPVEDVVLANEEEQSLCDELKPKVLQILTNYATIELRGNKYKIPRYGI